MEKMTGQYGREGRAVSTESGTGSGSSGEGRSQLSSRLSESQSQLSTDRSVAESDRRTETQSELSTTRPLPDGPTAPADSDLASGAERAERPVFRSVAGRWPKETTFGDEDSLGKSFAEALPLGPEPASGEEEAAGHWAELGRPAEGSLVSLDDDEDLLAEEPPDDSDNEDYQEPRKSRLGGDIIARTRIGKWTWNVKTSEWGLRPMDKLALELGLVVMLVLGALAIYLILDGMAKRTVRRRDWEVSMADQSAPAVGACSALCLFPNASLVPPGVRQPTRHHSHRRFPRLPCNRLPCVRPLLQDKDDWYWPEMMRGRRMFTPAEGREETVLMAPGILDAAVLRGTEPRRYWCLAALGHLARNPERLLTGARRRVTIQLEQCLEGSSLGTLSSWTLRVELWRCPQLGQRLPDGEPDAERPQRPPRETDWPGWPLLGGVHPLLCSLRTELLSARVRSQSPQSRLPYQRASLNQPTFLTVFVQRKRAFTIPAHNRTEPQLTIAQAFNNSHREASFHRY